MVIKRFGQAIFFGIRISGKSLEAFLPKREAVEGIIIREKENIHVSA
jgi:hypothetical protein